MLYNEWMQSFSKHRSFFDFFPPPKFLSMDPAGVVISDDSIKCIELVHTPKGVHIGQFGEESLPNGAISHGIIQNATAVEKALVAIQRKYKFSFVRAAFPERDAYLLELTLPFASRKSLREAIELQFEECVPMKRDESIFDFDVVGISEKQSIVRVQISTVSQAVAQTYESVFKNAGMFPVAFEAETQALARAVIEKDASGTALLVDIGKRETVFAVVRNGSVLFTSSIEIGGGAITQALSETLSIPLEKAEHDKCLYGVLPSLLHRKIAEVILEHVKPIEEKMRQHISYQETLEDKKIPVERVVICGGGSNLPGLSEYLEQALGLPVVRANPWVNSLSFDEYIPELPLGESLRYASAIGLAMSSINTSYRD